MRLTTRVTLGALAALALASSAPTARAGEDEIDRGIFKKIYSKQAARYYREPISLSAIRANPENYLNVYFRAWVRFHREENLETPEYTPFSREKFMNFSLWSADAKLWMESERMNDLPFCFAEKDDRIVYEIAQLHEYDMLLVYGRVRAVFLNEPWVEIIDVERSSKSTLNTAVLTHISVAEAMATDGLELEAIDEYTRALSYDLTDDVAAELWKRKGLIYLSNDRYAESIYALKKSVGLWPDSADTHLALAEASARAERYSDGLRAAQHALRMQGRQARAYALIGLCWRELTLKRLESLGINVSEKLGEALRRRRENIRPRDRFRGLGRQGTDEVQVSYLISEETKRKLREDLEQAVREGRKAIYLDPTDPDAGQWLAGSKKALEEFDTRIKEAEARRRGDAAEETPEEKPADTSGE